jgi:hypothetical protein
VKDRRYLMSKHPMFRWGDQIVIDMVPPDPPEPGTFQNWYYPFSQDANIISHGIAIDSAGTVHVVYLQLYGYIYYHLYYTRSDGNPETWITPVFIGETTWHDYVCGISVDSTDRVHIWRITRVETEGNYDPKSFKYAVSTNGGVSWGAWRQQTVANPAYFDDLMDNGHCVAMTDDGNVLSFMYEGRTLYGGIWRDNYMMCSTFDLGQTWSDWTYPNVYDTVQQYSMDETKIYYDHNGYLYALNNQRYWITISNLRCKVSNDYGVTWGAATDVIAEPVTLLTQVDNLPAYTDVWADSMYCYGNSLIFDSAGFVHAFAMVTFMDAILGSCWTVIYMKGTFVLGVLTWSLPKNIAKDAYYWHESGGIIYNIGWSAQIGVEDRICIFYTSTMNDTDPMVEYVETDDGFTTRRDTTITVPSDLGKNLFLQTCVTGAGVLYALWWGSDGANRDLRMTYSNMPAIYVPPTGAVVQYGLDLNYDAVPLTDPLVGVPRVTKAWVRVRNLKNYRSGEFKRNTNKVYDSGWKRIT